DPTLTLSLCLHPSPVSTVPRSLLRQPAHAPRTLHSFPTRRSSDLLLLFRPFFKILHKDLPCHPAHEKAFFRRLVGRLRREQKDRSEEHTSELQSRFDLVCRLLREKKRERVTQHAEQSDVVGEEQHE